MAAQYSSKISPIKLTRINKSSLFESIEKFSGNNLINEWILFLSYSLAYAIFLFFHMLNYELSII